MRSGCTDCPSTACWNSTAKSSRWPMSRAYSLCYFDDADREPMPTMLADIAWDDAKQTIQTWVKAMTA